MQPHLDLIAVATALVAIWYTVRESRRNNRVLLAIKDCATSGRQSVDENAGQMFCEFRLILQNNGISLHHVHASIGFRDPVSHGWCNLALHRRERSGDRDEFAKGMIVEFGFKSYELTKHDLAFLSMLRDPKNQCAQMRIFSQDYLAASFRIGGVWDRLKSRWNRLAYRFNDLFTRKGEVIYTYQILPLFPTLEQRIIDFARWTEKGKSAGK